MFAAISGEKNSDNLGTLDLKNTLTLSRKFQFAAERHSGAFTEYPFPLRVFKTVPKPFTADNALDFLRVYSGYRFRYLRTVCFETKFPELGYVYERPCRDNKARLLEKDEEFTRQINVLFATLKDREEQLEVAGNITLKISGPFTKVEKEVCLHHRFPSWRVHLLNPDSLPEILSVRSLDVEQGAHYSTLGCGLSSHDWTPSKLDLRVLVDLIIKLPNLESFSCEQGGDEWSPRQLENAPATHYLRDWEGPRRNSRHDFAAAVQANYERIPRNLRLAKLDFLFPIEGAEDIDHRTRMPDLRKSGREDLISPVAYDPFNSSLRLLSSHLRQLQLRVCADQTLFWPQDSAITPAWPHLESVEVMFHPVSPSAVVSRGA